VDLTDFLQWPREDPHARTTRADTARITGMAPPKGVTSFSREETGPAGETIPLDTTVAHGVTRKIFGFPHCVPTPRFFPRYLMNKRPTGL
jgi:hypothetical protein